MSGDDPQDGLNRAQYIIEHESHSIRPRLTLDDAFRYMHPLWMSLSEEERARRIAIWRTVWFAPHHYHLLIDRLRPEVFHNLYLERDKRTICEILYRFLTNPRYTQQP